MAGVLPGPATLGSVALPDNRLPEKPNRFFSPQRPLTDAIRVIFEIPVLFKDWSLSELGPDECHGLVIAL